MYSWDITLGYGFAYKPKVTGVWDSLMV